MEQEFETTNVSDLWLRNILENVKNLEHMERLAREGCSSILEFVQINNLDLPEIQYKNLRLMLNEIILLMSDISPVVEKTFYDDTKKKVKRFGDVINKRELFILETIDRTTSPPNVTSKKLTTLFDEALELVSEVKSTIVSEIAPILFVEKFDKKGEGKLK